MIANLRLALCNLRNNKASWRPGCNLLPPIMVLIPIRFAAGGGCCAAAVLLPALPEKTRGAHPGPIQHHVPVPVHLWTSGCGDITLKEQGFSAPHVGKCICVCVRGGGCPPPSPLGSGPDQEQHQCAPQNDSPLP